MPGASRTVIEAIVPYHAASLRDYLRSDDAGCTPATARAMAMTAYQRACRFADLTPVFGLGCTAAIATDRERRGSDRCHLSVQSAERTLALDISLTKSADRDAQETLCADALLWLMSWSLGLTREAFEMPVDAGEARFTEVAAPAAWVDLLAGRSRQTHTPATGLI
ncbi:MAG: hypothetical protein O3B72_12410, partial [Proteobacteria bacterium]|nr:hypothetical protein [Pseudomonadota bacterium]